MHANSHIRTSRSRAPSAHLRTPSEWEAVPYRALNEWDRYLKWPASNRPPNDPRRPHAMLGCRAATRGHTRCIRESDGIQRAAVGWHGCMVSLWPDEWPSDCAESDAAVLQLVPLCAHNEEPKTLCDTPRFEQSNRRIGVAYGNQPTDLTRRLQDTCDCLSLS